VECDSHLSAGPKEGKNRRIENGIIILNKLEENIVI
jgi:hypothetical protein